MRELLRVIAGVNDGVEIVKSIPEEVKEIDEYFTRCVLSLIKLELFKEGLHQQHNRVRREATYD